MPRPRMKSQVNRTALPPEAPKVTAVILAGGRAQRMGAVEKGLQKIHQRNLIEHVIASIGPQVDSIIINANRDFAQYQQFGLPIVADKSSPAIQGESGPLAGIQAALLACNDPLLLCVPCDTPHLPSDLVNRLKHALLEKHLDLVYAAEYDQQQQIKSHPVICLMRKEVLDSLTKYLLQGQKKVSLWFDHLDAEAVIFSDANETAIFRNLNTIQELKEYELAIKASSVSTK